MNKLTFILFLNLGLFISLLGFTQDAPLLTQQENLIINSEEVKYNGKEIILSKQVIIQHPIGKISAGYLSLSQPEIKNKKNSFNLLKIQDEIQIELKEGGEIRCQLAEIDFSRKKGFFLGNLDHPEVTYTYKSNKNKKDDFVSMGITSHELSFQLADKTSPGQSSISQIKAEKKVRIDYQQTYFCSADQALYQPLSSTSFNEALLHLSAGIDQPYCRLKTINGDQVLARTLQINTAEHWLKMTQPEGIFYLDKEKNLNSSLNFTANELKWDDLQRQLSFKGPINLALNDKLYLQTDHELDIQLTSDKNKPDLKSIKIPQEVLIFYSDADKNNTHKINCPGSFIIDHENHLMTLQSSPSLLKQVYLDDTLGEINADFVSVQYRWDNEQFIPDKILLKGNVHLVNRFDGHTKESGSVLNYALADQIEYLPMQQLMTLQGSSSSPVLFFDKINNVQMSAQSLKIERDPVTKKDFIQGLGNVRFTFIEKEIEQIKRLFNINETSQKECQNGSNSR